MNLPHIPGYEFEELIGEGGCGAVYRSRFEGRELRAVKVLNGLAVNPGLLSHAMTTVANLNDQSRLLPVHTYNLGQKPYFYVTDYFDTRSDDPTTIEDLAGKLERTDGWRIIEQLIESIALLHKNDVIHTSIKPWNIFVQRDESKDARCPWKVRVGDFGQGLVAGLHYFEMGRSCYFASPEQLTNGDFSHGKGKRWDVYSFGVVAFQLLTGKLPRLDDRYQASLKAEAPTGPTAVLHRDDPMEFFDLLQQQPQINWTAKPKNDYEAQLREVIDQCLDLDPAKRPVDMRDIARTFENIRHAADMEVIQRRHAAQLRSKNIKSGTLATTTGLFLLTSLGLMAAAFVGFSKLGSATLALLDAGNEKKRALAAQAADYENQLDESHQVRDEALADAEHRQQLADNARNFLDDAFNNGDQFLEAVLKAKDVDYPGFQEDRMQRLTDSQGYLNRFLEEYDGDEKYELQNARAKRYLAEIHHAKGNLNDALSSYGKSRDVWEEMGQKEEFRSMAAQEIARIDRNRADVRYDLGRIDEAELALRDSNAGYRALLNEDPRAALALVENEFLLGEIAMSRRDYDAARTSFNAVIEPLISSEQPDAISDSHRYLLARAFHQMGLIFRNDQQTDGALEMQRQAAEQFGLLIVSNDEIDDYQYYLARSLNQRGELQQDPEVLLSAHKLLDNIVEKNPENHRYRLELANSFGRVSEIQRDKAQAQEARDFNALALELLDGLLAQESTVPAYRFAKARETAVLAQLESDAQNFERSVELFTQATDALEQLLTEDETHPQYLLHLARASGNAGFAREQHGDDSTAKTHYNRAIELWNQIQESKPEDEEVTSSLEWAERQLDRLD